MENKEFFSELKLLHWYNKSFLYFQEFMIPRNVSLLLFEQTMFR